MRAQVYSIIAILIAIPVMLFVADYLVVSQPAGAGSADRVVADQMTQLGGNIENDFARATGISLKRALIAASNQVTLDGVYLNDSVSAVQELVLNGTLNSSTSVVMLNNTLGDWRSRILSVATGFDTDLAYSNFTAENHDGLNAEAGVELNVVVTDKLGTSRLNRTSRRQVLVSVENVEDPVFPLSTNGFVRRVISFCTSNYSALDMVSGSQAREQCTGNVTTDSGASSPSGKILVVADTSGIPDPTLQGFAGVVTEATENLTQKGVSCYVTGASGAVAALPENESMFLDNETASVWSLPIAQDIASGCYRRGFGPDILRRLEGNLSNTSSGMETWVNIPDLENAGLEIKEGQSNMAYLYFSEQDYSGHRVRGLPDWFRIDTEHADNYNLTQLLET